MHERKDLRTINSSLIHALRNGRSSTENCLISANASCLLKSVALTRHEIHHLILLSLPSFLRAKPFFVRLIKFRYSLKVLRVLCYESTFLEQIHNIFERLSLAKASTLAINSSLIILERGFLSFLLKAAMPC